MFELDKLPAWVQAALAMGVAIGGIVAAILGFRNKSADQSAAITRREFDEGRREVEAKRTDTAKALFEQHRELEARVRMLEVQLGIACKDIERIDGELQRRHRS